MLITIDMGNTRAKAALFNGYTLEKTWPEIGIAELIRQVNNQPHCPIMLSAVGDQATHFINLLDNKERLTLLNYETKLPFTNTYTTPNTLGTDRIAAVAGAHFLWPNTPLLVIDAGTCITYDFIDANAQYVGGSISPGVKMRYSALHEFTSKLPLVEPMESAMNLIGTNTKTAIQTGVQYGVLCEVEGFIKLYTKLHPTLKVIACGGDGYLFKNIHTCQYVPELVLMGLNVIWLHTKNIGV